MSRFSQIQTEIADVREEWASRGKAEKAMSAEIADLQWIAGFLEGEGSFTYHASLAVSASQVQRWPLEKLRVLLGGSISTNGRLKQPQRQLCSVWYLHGYRAAALMMTIWSLMSPRRQKQIEVALAKWVHKKVANQQREHCPLGHPYKQLKNRRICTICANESNRKGRIRAGHYKCRDGKDQPRLFA